MVKKITIEDLAKMIKKGFDNTATVDQVNNLKKRVDNLEGWADKRFDNIDRELKIIRKKLENVVYRNEFEDLKSRVKELEDLFAIPSRKH